MTHAFFMLPLTMRSPIKKTGAKLCRVATKTKLPLTIYCSDDCCTIFLYNISRSFNPGTFNLNGISSWKYIKSMHTIEIVDAYSVFEKGRIARRGRQHSHKSKDFFHKQLHRKRCIRCAANAPQLLSVNTWRAASCEIPLEIERFWKPTDIDNVRPNRVHAFDVRTKDRGTEEGERGGHVLFEGDAAPLNSANFLELRAYKNYYSVVKGYFRYKNLYTNS